MCESDSSSQLGHSVQLLQNGQASQPFPQQVQQQASQRFPQQVQQQASQRFPQRVQQQASQRFPQRVQQQASQRFPQRVQPQASQQFPQQVQQQASQRFPQQVQQQASQRFPQRVQQQASQQFPQQVQQQASQQFSQQFQPKQPVVQAEPLEKCAVADYEQIQCGPSGISGAECQAINCCFNGQQCFYGKAVTVQCIRYGQFVVVVARDVMLPRLSLDSVCLLGGNDPPCSPLGSTPSFAIYQFSVTACGTSMMMPLPDDRYLTTLVPVAGPSGLQFPTYYKRFVVKMFTFVDPASLAPLQETIFIHCSTVVCHPSSGSCEQSCSRKRRDANIKTISSVQTVVSSREVNLVM